MKDQEFDNLYCDNYPGYPGNPSCPDYYGPEYDEGPCWGEYPDYNIYDWINLAEAFVIWQRFEKLYCPGEALQKGTLFSELWQPYGNQRRKQR